jgi:hypothetical protein
MERSDMYLRTAKLTAIISGMALCTGCANLTTISRRTALPKSNEDGVAIHLDQQQRIAYYANGMLCAEPSPDALQATSASTGTGAAAPKDGSISIAQAIQESAGSNGLRTQSITLMRDGHYRICEAYRNGKLGDQAVAQLLERSQDVTLGVLAIEQLTGAVVAKQVVLSGNANGSSSANVANTQAALDNAQRIEKQKKQALDDAQKQLDTDSAKLKADQAVSPTTDKITAEINTLTATTIPADQANVASATTAYKNAQDTTQAIENNFNAALSAASAAATGNGQFSDGGGAAKNIDKDTASVIAQAVQGIVTAIVNKGHLTDTCANFLADYSSGKIGAAAAAANQTNKVATPAADTFALCAQVITADIAAQAAMLKTQTGNGSTPPTYLAPAGANANTPLVDPFLSLHTDIALKEKAKTKK